MVQTAYANGASTRYITEALGLQVVCAKTGAHGMRVRERSKGGSLRRQVLMLAFWSVLQPDGLLAGRPAGK